MDSNDIDSKRTLFVRGLAEGVTKEVLYAAFIPYGEIRHLEVPLDKTTGKHKGFGFVEFEEGEDASHAVFNRNNSELYGKVLRVTYSTHADVYEKKSYKNKAIWADPEYYKQKLVEAGVEVPGGEVGLSNSAANWC